MDKDNPILPNAELNTEDTKCTPPYAKCLHGHFYQAALTIGYNASDAEQLTEKVKLLTQIDKFEVQTNIPNHTWYNMGTVKEFIRQSILELPIELQADAIRVVYRIYFQNTWHTTMDATIDIHRFIFSTFPEALIGDTYYWTFERWKEGVKLPFLHPGEERIYNQGTMKWETDILQEEEYVKILDYAKEWCEQYIQFNLNKLKQPFLDKYNRTEKPKELLKKEKKEYKKLIKDKSIALETSVNANRILFIKRPGQSNFIPDLYQYLVVEAGFNPIEHARPELPFDMVLNIRELLVFVVSRYIDLLDSLAKNHGNSKKPNRYGNNKEKESTLEVVTFKSLFMSTDGEELCEQLGQKLGISKMVQSEEEDKSKNRYKAVFAALWQFLKDHRPQIVNDVSDQKACEAIASKFNSKVGKNLWSSGAMDSEKGKVFYKQLEAIMREIQT